MRTYTFCCLCLLFSFPLHGQEKNYSTKYLKSINNTFLCLMDKSTGFIFDKKNQSWNVQIFKANDQKFILDLDKRGGGIFYRFGSKIVDRKKINSKCKKSRKTGFVECKGWLGDVQFSKESNLITHSFIYGYAVDNISIWNNMSLTPSVSIGKCSQLKLNSK